VLSDSAMANLIVKSSAIFSSPAFSIFSHEHWSRWGRKTFWKM